MGMGFLPQLMLLNLQDGVHKRGLLTKTEANPGPQKLRFNLPLMVLASRFASVEQQKSLKSSSVKLAARDVATRRNVHFH